MMKTNNVIGRLSCWLLCVGLLLALPGQTNAGLVISGGGLTLVEESGTFAAGNLASLVAGGSPFAFDSLQSPPTGKHTIPHLNDLTYGNANSWIGKANSPTLGEGFAGISLDGLRVIDSIAFGRGNGQTYDDRWQGLYTLQHTTVASPDKNTPDANWTTIGTLDYQSAGGTNFSDPTQRHRYTMAPVVATGMRIIVPEVYNDKEIGDDGATCIDEIELYGGDVEVQLAETGGTFGVRNVAAVSAGGTAFAKDSLSGYHNETTLNDGTYGNTSSWIGNTNPSFCGVAFDGPYMIHGIAFGRDNGGEAQVYMDRYQGTYTLQYTTVENPDENTLDSLWANISDITYTTTFPDVTGWLRHRWEFDPILGVTGVRILVDAASGQSPIAIDELDVYAIPEPSTLTLILLGVLGLALAGRRRRPGFRLT